MQDDTIQVCYALHDREGARMRHMGASIASLLANTERKVRIHLIHDALLSTGDREKFRELVEEKHGQALVLHSMEGAELPERYRELLADRMNIVLPPEHPLANSAVSLQDLRDETFVLLESGYSLITEKMFQDGLVGLDNKQNEASHSAKEIRHSAMPYWLGAIKVTLYKIFPPYRDMQLIPWYSFVDGRPWLLPFAWIYRWGDCLIKKRKASEELLAEPFVKRTQIDERNRRMAEWGL